MKQGQVVQEEMSFKEKNTDGRTTDRQITLAHIEPLAQVSLKCMIFYENCLPAEDSHE